MTDVSAARERAERVIGYPVPSGWVNLKAQALARDVVVLADRVEAARVTEEDLMAAYEDMHHRALDAEARAAECETALEHWRERAVAAQKVAARELDAKHRAVEMLGAAEARVAELEKAIAEAMRSLMEDSYAYSVLDAALSPVSPDTEEPT